MRHRSGEELVCIVLSLLGEDFGRGYLFLKICRVWRKSGEELVCIVMSVLGEDFGR